MTQNSKSQPNISILVSTYNWPEALVKCVQSIWSQTILPNEIVIADDGSNSSTKTCIQQLIQQSPVPIQHIWHEDDGFRLAAIRNKAIKACKYDYIIQIDGDILLEPHFIADHIRLAEKDHFLCGSRVWVSEEHSKELILQKEGLKINKSKLPFSSILNSFRSSLFAQYLADRYKKNKPRALRGCNMSFWKADLLKVNGYDESIQGWGSEDAELALRLMNAGIKKRFLKFAAVAYHLYHKENDKSNLSKNEKVLFETVYKNKTWTDHGIKKL